MVTVDRTNPRTWGNCIRREDLPPVLNEQCEWNPEMPCLRPARVWRWAPQGGWYPMCYEHADVIAALQRLWDEAEDTEFGR